MTPAYDVITIKLEEYIDLLGDKALLGELSKLGLDKLPIYDKAVLNTFLSASRRFDIESEEEIERLKRRAEETPFRSTSRGD